jgi:hypothetical protein
LYNRLQHGLLALIGLFPQTNPSRRPCFLSIQL